MPERIFGYGTMFFGNRREVLFLRILSGRRAGRGRERFFLKLDIIGICILDRIYRIMQDK